MRKNVLYSATLLLLSFSELTAQSAEEAERIFGQIDKMQEIATEIKGAGILFSIEDFFRSGVRIDDPQYLNIYTERLSFEDRFLRVLYHNRAFLEVYFPFSVKENVLVRIVTHMTKALSQATSAKTPLYLFLDKHPLLMADSKMGLRIHNEYHLENILASYPMAWAEKPGLEFSNRLNSNSSPIKDLPLENDIKVDPAQNAQKVYDEILSSKTPAIRHRYTYQALIDSYRFKVPMDTRAFPNLDIRFIWTNYQGAPTEWLRFSPAVTTRVSHSLIPVHLTTRTKSKRILDSEDVANGFSISMYDVDGGANDEELVVNTGKIRLLNRDLRWRAAIDPLTSTMLGVRAEEATLVLGAETDNGEFQITLRRLEKAVVDDK